MQKHTSIGAFKAKTHFAQLLDRVAHGEEIWITRHGKVVAKMIPALSSPNDSIVPQERTARARALVKQMKLGSFDWEEWKKDRDTGKH